MTANIKISSAPSWFSEKLGSICYKSGIRLAEEQLSILKRHAEWVMCWNKTTNLMGKISWESLIELHYLDSIIPAKWLPSKGRAMDIGTGAGFPGIPLWVVGKGNLDFLLSDVRRKKVSFLKVFLSYEKASSIRVVNRPWQEIIDEKNVLFDLVTVRALKLMRNDLKRIVERGLTSGGVLAMWCGPRVGINNLHFGFGTLDVYHYTLPGNRKRVLLLVRKG